MRFSVIIPVYNTAAHLKACVQSLLDQDFTDFEIILIDDGSTDDSWEICREFAHRDARIQCHQQDHQGVSAARNLGLAFATGEHLTFFDSDDTSNPKVLLLADQIITRDEVELIIFSINHYIITSSHTSHEPWRVADRQYDSPSDFVADLLSGKRLLLYSCANKFYQRSLISKHHLRFKTDVHFGEDRMFNFEYLQHVRKIVTSAYFAYNYYTRPIPSLSQEYRSGHITKLLTLHRAKQQWIDGVLPTHESRTLFLAADLHYELQSAWQHLQRYWPRLSTPERRQEIRALTSSHYPAYFSLLKRRGSKTRLLIFLIEHRLHLALRLLFSLSAHFSART